jgi:16S rRNA processing protein RimM
MAADEAKDAWVWLARIRRPQGRKGEVFAEILTDFPEKFTERRRLWLVEGDPPAKKAGVRPAFPKLDLPKRMELKAHWLHKGGVVLHFAGFDSISAAETLTGLAVAIPRDERAALEGGAVYISDLIGCTLFDVAGGGPEKVGEIEDVDRSAGTVAMLVVRGAQGEVLIPWAESYLRKVDIEARRVEMALPEGLVDLNRPDQP